MKRESLIRRTRRWLAKRLEVGPALEPAWDFFIKQSLRGAAELRKHLSIDENIYFAVAPQAISDARAYVIYTALDEVKKTSMHLMRLAELIDCPPFSPRSNRLDRLLVTQVIEEREARIRRLLEVLVTLILFDGTNEQPYYRHMLLLERLRNMLSEMSDIEEFFGISNSNLNESIAMQVKWIEEVEKQVELSKCWYSYERRRVAAVKRLRAERVLSTMRTRVKTAVPLMNAREKLIFGLTYNGGYGRTSTAIHYSANRSDYLLESGAEREMIEGAGLMMISILVRCYRLMGRPEAPIVAKLEDVTEKAVPQALYETTAALEMEVGDFVLAHGDLAEVVGAIVSRFGYKSYRVRYLAERPMPHIREDTFPSRHIKILQRRSEVIERMKQEVARQGGPKDFSEQIDRLRWEEAQAILREAVGKTWKAGFGQRLRG